MPPAPFVITAAATGFVAVLAGGVAAAAPPSHARASVAAVAAAAPAHRPGPSAPPAGNLAVTVPVTPPPAMIAHFCRELLTGRTPPANRWFTGFVTETGGSVASTVRWCVAYEARRRA